MSEQFYRYKNIIEKNLNDKATPWEPILAYLEEKSGVKRIYLFLGKFIYLFYIALFYLV